MAEDSDFVRVRTKNGFETSVSRAYLEGLEESKDHTVLKEDAESGAAFGRVRAITRKGGRPLLPVTSVDEEAAKKSEETK